MLYEVFLDYRHFDKYTHFFGVHNAHVGVYVVCCAVKYDKFTEASWLDEGRVKYDQILRIGEH